MNGFFWKVWYTVLTLYSASAPGVGNLGSARDTRENIGLWPWKLEKRERE